MAMGTSMASDPLAGRTTAPSAYSVQHAIHDATRNRKRDRQSKFPRPPKPSTARLEASISDYAFSVEDFIEYAETQSKDETVLYLAYGSNLQAAKFRGDRGIKPLSQINVVVPSLRMTFDLPGIPYAEPCFANTARRTPSHEPPPDEVLSDEKTGLLSSGQKERYKKRNWHKGLVGVVYEVTPKDYAHIIATEGGGSGYQDILVDCHPFASDDPSQPVPDMPSLPSFKAHTLFAPRLPEGEEPPRRGGHVQRPDPDYAQASARYLKIMTDGATECDLPYEYQDFLQSLRPYTITTAKQRIGQFVFLAMWMPIVLSMFGLGKLVVDKKGRLPGWMVELTNAVFRGVWASYDGFARPLFGDGERTIDKDEDRDDEDQRHMKGRGLGAMQLALSEKDIT